ncbi:MAG: PTS sugar transporter subunit IIA, partial [Pseudomonadota bacterium]
MTNDISQFLTAQNTILNLNTGCKRGALKELSLYAAKQLDLDPDHLLQILLEREQLGTTGIGRGVAVPHARVDVKELTGFLAKLSKPVDFDAIDDEPVD